MGLFDVRCAVSGLILQSGRTLIVPLVRRGKQHVAVGLPIAGEYDRYGRLDPIDDDPIAAHFAKRFVARASIDSPPKSGLKAFVRRMTDTNELAPTLDGNPIEIAYVHRGVYEALVAHGTKGESASGDALFDAAFSAAVEARDLYQGLPSANAPALARALTDFAKSGLGHRPIAPRKVADYIQASKKQLTTRLAKARRELAVVPTMKAAFDDYERRAIRGEDPDAIRVAPLLRTMLGEELGLRAEGESFVREHDGERLRVEVKEGAEIVDVWLELTIDGRGTSRGRLARVDLESNAREVAEAVASIKKALPGKVEEHRVLAGGDATLDRIVELAKESRWFLDLFAGAPAASPATLTELALAMKRFPYSDDVRLAWIKMLARPDCPRAIAEALADHTSKSLKDAAAARLARK